MTSDVPHANNFISAMFSLLPAMLTAFEAGNRVRGNVALLNRSAIAIVEIRNFLTHRIELSFRTNSVFHAFAVGRQVALNCSNSTMVRMSILHTCPVPHYTTTSLQRINIDVTDYLWWQLNSDYPFS